MPVNLLHSWFHRVEEGWDPISPAYAKEYAEFASRQDRKPVVERLEAAVGGLQGKRILDLGGGPGQFSVLFAQRGARVVWHDISRQYLAIAQSRAAAAGVSLEFSLGYLEAASKFGLDSFDVVFCRVCWYYCRNDRKFAKLLYSLVKPGGLGYLECNTPAFSRPTGFRWVQHFLNTYFWWKVGHPMPPRGRIAKLIQKYPIRYMEQDYSSELCDIVLFRKSGS